MAAGAHSFKRLVLGLAPSAPDRAMRVAVDFAALLHVDLLGLFLEDTALHDLARIPFAREFRPLGGGWHPIDLERMSHDLDLAARSVERFFTEAASGLATNCRFEVARGPTSETIASISRSGDIVIVAEPASPAERATRQFEGLIAAAFRSAAAVLVVPPRIARRAGAIVAVAAAPDDPSVETAAAIALAAKENLILIESGERAFDEARLRALVDRTGLAVRRIAAGKAPLTNPAACAQAFRTVKERLVVMTRDARTPDAALSIASVRQIPVLVIEPEDTPN
jgi:hypothetical protein